MKDIKKEELENISGGAHWGIPSDPRNDGGFVLDSNGLQAILNAGYNVKKINANFLDGGAVLATQFERWNSAYNITNDNGDPITETQLQQILGDPEDPE